MEVINTLLWYLVLLGIVCVLVGLIIAFQHRAPRIPTAPLQRDPSDPVEQLMRARNAMPEDEVPWFDRQASWREPPQT